MNLPDSEAAVIGAMILDPHRIDEVTLVVSESDFIDHRLRELFIILVDLYRSGAPINETALIKVLTESNALNRIGGYVTIATAVSAIGNAADAAYYAGQVRHGSIIRMVQKTLSEATRRSLIPNQPPDELLDYIDAQLLSIRNVNTTSDTVTSISDAALRLCDEIEAAAETNTHRGLRTGLAVFDRINGGFQDGTLNIIAARPSNGKSVLALQFAEGIGRGFRFSIADNASYLVSDQPATPTLFVSLEMSEEELSARSLAAATEIDSRRINSYRLTAQERRRLRSAADSMQAMKVSLWEPHRATVSAIRAKARLQKRRSGLGCLVIDYLQLVDSEPGSRHDMETYRIGEICRHLKQLARELSIPVIVCCQLNRDAENNKPSLAQLSDSGKIEQHADTITAIHRTRGETTDATLRILKWRNGQTPEVDLTFDRQYCRFVELGISRHSNYEPSFAEYADSRH